MKTSIFGIVLACITLLCGLILSAMKRQNSRVRLKRYTVESGKIPQNFDGFSMFVISDLHNAPFAGQIAELVKATAPDVIFFTGDLILGDKTVNLGEAGKLIDTLGGRFPLYGISGNHEGGNSETAEQFRNRGGIWLEDSRERIVRDGESICLIGLKDRTFADSKTAEQEILAVMQETEADTYTVTLCHNPKEYAVLKDCPTDIILAGHEHGGLVRLPKIGGLFGHEGQRILPHYCYGRYRDGKAEMIISGGCDDGSHYPRLNNPPEVLLVTLYRK